MLAITQITLRDVTDITIASTAPANPVLNMLWLDVSEEPATVRRWDGADWVTTGIDAGVIELIQERLDQQAERIDDKANKADLTNKADMSAVQTLFESLVTQTDVNITYQFNKATTATMSVDGKIDEFETLVKSYITFGDVGDGDDPGIKIGVSDSPFMSKWGIDKLSFLQDDEEVAYISNNKLYITYAQITKKLSIGSADNGGWFDWITTPQGMGLKWRSA